MYNPKIELRHLRYFVAVAEELHFSRAAKKLQIAQPPLSQQIRQLEQIAGVQLFERDHHSVALTNAGQVFFEEARTILERVEYAISQAQQAQQGYGGRLVIGFGGSTADTIIPAILQVYCSRFPRVEVSLRDMSSQAQLQALQEQQIQVGFMPRPQQTSAELCSEVIRRDPLVVVFTQSHHLVSQAAVTIRSLADESFILFARQASQFFHDQVIHLCNSAGFSPRITQEVSDIRMLLGLVSAGLGISIVPASSVMVRKQNVAYRPFVDVTASIEIALLWRCHESSALVQEFLAVAREVLKHLANS